MKKPILQSGDDETWAPAGMDYYDGKLYFAGLRGQSLYVININDDKPTIERYLTKEYGRLRAVTVYHADLYIGTSNRDGRGSPKQDDDQIFSVPLSLL